jgi:hypothetical protein
VPLGRRADRWQADQKQKRPALATRAAFTTSNEVRLNVHPQRGARYGAAGDMIDFRRASYSTSVGAVSDRLADARNVVARAAARELVAERLENAIELAGLLSIIAEAVAELDSRPRWWPATGTAA